MEVALWRRGASAISSWTPEQRDTVVYASAAAFALGTMRLSSITLYQQWARIAIGPYIVGTVISLLTVRRARRREQTNVDAPLTKPHNRLSGVRVAIFLFVLAGSTLLPLTLEVFLQSQSGGTTHVQPEVLVVERSGRLVANGKDPYTIVTGKKLTGQAAAAMKGQPAYDEYDPYGPLMALFGVPSSWHASPKITDARLYFALLTVMLVAIALALCRGSSEPRLLALQGMTVLPTAALPMATAGDDLPVAAVLLVGVFLLHKRRPLLAGFMLGFAAGLKFTAWPLVLLAFLIARDREGRRGTGIAWMSAGMAAVLIPSVLWLLVQNPIAFLDNVVRFPLGLGKFGSPAASALPGHILVTMFPQIRHVLPVALAIGAAAILVWVIVRHRPRTVSDVCRLGGWLMTAGILFAPATRVGYLLYPINFFIWAWLLRSEEDAEVYQEANAVVRAAQPEPAPIPV